MLDRHHTSVHQVDGGQASLGEIGVSPLIRHFSCGFHRASWGGSGIDWTCISRIPTGRPVRNGRCLHRYRSAVPIGSCRLADASDWPTDRESGRHEEVVGTWYFFRLEYSCVCWAAAACLLMVGL